MTAGLLAGKRGLIMGVANERSSAWGIAAAAAEAGADLAFTYQMEGFGKRLRPLAQSVGSDLMVECDVAHEGAVGKAFDWLAGHWSSVDFVVHALAFSDKNELKGGYLNTSRGNFNETMMISAFSFTEVAQAARQMMPDGGSLVTLSYIGAQRISPNYNVMGVAKAALEASTRYLAADLGEQKIRVNCISAGPVNTLAARGIAGFSDMLKHYDEHAPLRRNVTHEELGQTGVFLASDGGAAITGQVIYVDCGYQIMGGM